MYSTVQEVFSFPKLLEPEAHHVGVFQFYCLFIPSTVPILFGMFLLYFHAISGDGCHEAKVGNPVVL